MHANSREIPLLNRVSLCRMLKQHKWESIVRNVSQFAVAFLKFQRLSWVLGFIRFQILDRGQAICNESRLSSRCNAMQLMIGSRSLAKKLAYIAYPSRFFFFFWITLLFASLPPPRPSSSYDKSMIKEGKKKPDTFEITKNSEDIVSSLDLTRYPTFFFFLSRISEKDWKGN